MSGWRDITTSEAIAWCLDPRNDNYGGTDKGIVHVMAANYDPNGEEGEYDGLTPEDVATMTEDGVVDEDYFGEWGPFHLQWEDDEDPGQPRPWSPDEAVNRLDSFVSVFEREPGYDPTLRIAIDVLAAFVKQVGEHGSTDLEWGEPGDCQQRIDNDEDIGAALADAMVITEEARDEFIVANGLGRHYGDPHCIWCLQAS